MTNALFRGLADYRKLEGELEFHIRQGTDETEHTDKVRKLLADCRATLTPDELAQVGEPK